jgi:hypothetical protein
MLKEGMTEIIPEKKGPGVRGKNRKQGLLYF